MNVNVAGATRVVLPVKAASIKGTARVGNALEVYLANGNVITLENYFPNKPALLTNEHDNTVAEFVINDDGTIEGVKALSAEEAETLLGNGYSALSTSPNDILILTPNDTIGAVAAPSYDVAVFAASAALLAGAFILADRDSNDSNQSATPNRTTETTTNADGSTTTVTKEDTNGDGTVDKTTTVTKDKDGNTTSTKTEETTKNPDGSTTTVTKEDTNGDGTVDKTTTVTKDKDGNTTSTKTEETTKNPDGSTTTVTKEDTNGDGTVDKTTTVTKDKDGNTTSTKTEDTTGLTPTNVNVQDNPNGNGDQVTGTTKPGADVVVKDKDGNVIGTGKADENGDFAVDVPPQKDGDKVTVETKDPTTGNTGSTEVTVGDKPLTPINVDVQDNPNGNGDQVTGTTKPGADVVVKDKDGNVIGTGKADENGDFAVDVPPQKDGDKVTVETKDPTTGNTGSTEVTVGDKPLTPINVDVQDNPNGNGDQVTGTTKPGADVVVKDKDGNVIGTGKADENGDFAVDVPPQKDGDKVTVETKDPTTGNTGSTEVTVGDKPLTPINVDVQDNPNGNGDQVTGTTKPGADVVVKDKDGNVIGTGKADENGDFAVDVPPQKDGDKVTVETKDPTTGNTGSTEVTVGDKPLTPINVDVQDNPNGNGDQVTGTTKPGADVVVKDKDGNVIGTGKADENGDFAVDVPPQKDGDKVTVETKDPTTGNTGSTEVTVGDKPLTPINVDVQDNPNGNGDQVTGTTKPGADVVVKDKDGNVIGTGKADENGDFAVDVPPQKDGDKVTVETKDPTTGNTGSTEVTVGDKPLTPINVDVQDNPNGNGDQVTGTTKPGADVVVKDKDGNVIGTGKADENGDFAVDVPPQKDGDKVTVETKDPTTGNTGSTEVTVGDKPLTPINVDVQDNPNGNGDQVTGTTKPGADVVVKDKDGNVIGTGKADENGDFAVDVPPQKDGDKVTVETKDPTTGNTGSTEVTVGDKPLTPINVDVQDNPNGNGDQVTGTTKPGADVVVKDKDGNVIGTGKADENGDFAVDVPPQKDGDKVTVETKDPTTGNTGSTEVTVGDKPLTPINVDVQDNPNGNGDQVTGTTKPGADVVVKDEQGNVIGTGKADEQGNFTVDVPEQKDGSKVTVETKDPVTGNEGKTEVTVGEPSLEPKNVDVQDNPNGNGDQVTGTTKPGADVVVKDEQGNVIGTGKADEQGNFTVDVPEQKDGSKVTVETKDPVTGNEGKTEVTVGEPSLEPKNVDVQDNPNGNGDQVTGTTKPGADVVVKDEQGNVIGTGKADEQGNFTVDVPEQKDGSKVTVETKDPVTGNEGKTEVTVGEPSLEPKNVDVQDNPNGNGDQVTGTTKPGADVVVKDEQGNVIGTGKADEQGNFTVDVPEQKDGTKLTVNTEDPATGNEGKTEVTVGEPSLEPKNVDVQDNPNGNGDQVTGTTKPGADVVVKDEQGNVIGTGKADEQGNFTVDVPEQKDGSKVTVETKDPVTGNEGKTEVTVGNTGGDTGNTGGNTGGDTGNTGGNTGGDTGNTGGNTGGDTGNTGGDTGNTGGNTGGDTGNTGGNTGGDTGNTGGNTGGDTGNTGGNTGGDTGNTGGNTGGDTGNTGGDTGNTGGNTGGDTGNTGGDTGNTGGNTGGDTGNTGGNTGGDTGNTGGNTGGDTGNTGGNTGGDTGNTGGDTGNTGGNTGGDTGNTGGNTGGDTGNTGGNTGGDTGNTGGNTGGDTGNTGGNTGGDTGNTGGDTGNTGGNTGGDTGNTGGNTGGDTGNTGGNTGGDTGNTGGNTGGDTGNTGGDTGNTGGDTGNTGGNTGGDTGNTGGDTGNTGGNTGGDTGNTGGNTGGDTGNTGGNTGGDTGNTGGNTGGDTGNTGGNTGGDTGNTGGDTGNTGGNTGGDTGNTGGDTGNTGGNTGGDTGNTGGNTGGDTGNTGGNTGGDTGNTGGDTGNTGGDTGNTGGNTGGDTGNTGGDTGNTGGNTGGDTGNTGGDTGNTGGNTGGDTGNTGGDTGNTGGDTGNTGGNTGGDTGNTGGNTGGDTGNTGGNTGGDTGNTGGDTGNTGGNTGGDTGNTGGNTGGDTGNTGGDTGNTGGNTGGDTGDNKDEDTTPPEAPTNIEVNQNGTEVTGKAEPGTTVTVKDPTGKVLGSAKAGEDGSFSVPVSPAQKNGETLSVEATDPAGNKSPVATVTAPDTTAPVAPTETAVNPNGTAVTGKAEPGTTVTVKDPTGKVLGSAKAGEDGSFSVPVSPAQKNGETLSVEATDPAGNKSPVATTTAPDTTAPVAPTETAVNPNGTAVTGKAEPGTTVTVKDPTGKVLGSAKAGEDGSFSVPVSPAQKNGETLSVEATDPAGNKSPVATTTAPDTTAPVAPTETAVNPNGTAVTGKAEPGTTVTVKDPTGKVLGSAKAGEDGSFSVPVSPAQKNGETLSVEATDPAGNKSPVATTTAPDTTAPVAPTETAVNPNGTAVTGKAEPGTTVTVKDPTGKVLGSAKAGEDGSFSVPVSPAQKNGEALSVEATDPAGNKSPAATATAPDTTAPTAPTSVAVNPNGTAVTGKAEPGATVTVKDDQGKVLGSAKAGEDGSFSVPVSPAKTNGETLTAEATDPAGNKSPVATTTAPDKTAPEAPTEVKHDGLTITGDAEPGSVVKIKAPDGTVLGSAKANENGKFEVTLSELPPEKVNVTATDEAGNESSATPLAIDLSQPDVAFIVDGKLIYTYYDINYDGIVDRAEVATYDKDVQVDAQGKVTNDAKVVQIDSYLEGTDIANGKGAMATVKAKQNLALTDADQKAYFTYDSAGRVQQRLYDLDAQSSTGETVSGKPGIDKFERVIDSRTINVDGKEVVLETQIAYNNDAKGDYDARAYYQYDAKGQRTLAFYDDNADGKVDRAERYTYDANGNVIRIDYDNDANGVRGNTTDGLTHSGTGIDKVEYFTYEAKTVTVNGEDVVKYLNTAKYTNSDAQSSTGSAYTINGQRVQGIDSIEKNTYNDLARLTKIEYDNNGDGTTDKIHYQQLDKLGRVEKLLVDADAKTGTGKTQTDSSGANVRGIDQVVEYTLNVKGEVTEMKRDNNVDGTYDYREVYNLNPNGNWEAKLVDLTNDGILDRKEVYTKEADDGLVKTHFYNLVDGQDVLTKVEDYTLNANNQRTSVKVDTLGNGTTDAVTRYDLDSLGRVAKAYFDTNGDGTVNRAETYTHDSNGNILRTQTDLGNDGSIDAVITYERNALGQVTKEMVDSDNNGSVDIVRYQEYDEFGNQLSRKIDNGNDGTINEAYYWTYNERNQQTHLIYDRTGNGVTDDDQRYEYTYDEFGREVSRLTQNNLSSPKSLTLSEYDALGRRVKASNDNDNDGEISSAQDSIIEYTYDAMNLTNGETRYDGTGKLLFTADIDRNDAGVIVRSYRDNGGDGTVDSLHYGYVGPNWTQNYTDDLTQWSAEQLAKVKGLPYIQLSGTTYETTITLDSATLAQIAPTGNTLRITGDATDTVNLEGFTQSASSSRAGHNQYTADVDGTTYTVFITDTVETVLG